jgi:hypothetical protein
MKALPSSLCIFMIGFCFGMFTIGFALPFLVEVVASGMPSGGYHVQRCPRFTPAVLFQAWLS